MASNETVRLLKKAVLARVRAAAVTEVLVRARDEVATAIKQRRPKSIYVCGNCACGGRGGKGGHESHCLGSGTRVRWRVRGVACCSFSSSV